MVGALRRGGLPQSPALHRAAAHIHSSLGRSTCLRQTLPLSFVFGPERSLTQFKEVCCPQNAPWSPGGPSVPGLHIQNQKALSWFEFTSSPYCPTFTPCLAAQLSGKRPSSTLPLGLLNLRQVTEPFRNSAVGMLVSASPVVARV